MNSYKEEIVVHRISTTTKLRLYDTWRNVVNLD